MALGRVGPDLFTHPDTNWQMARGIEIDLENAPAPGLRLSRVASAETPVRLRDLEVGAPQLFPLSPTPTSMACAARWNVGLGPRAVFVW
jgi:hypothetical protein